MNWFEALQNGLHAPLSPLGGVIADVLFHSVWQGAIIGIAVWITLASMRRNSAQTRYATACAGLLLLALAPCATVAVIATGPAKSLPTTVDESTTPAEASLAPAPGSESQPVPTASTLPAVAEEWQPTILLVWLAGIAMLCTWHAVGLSRLRVLRRRGIERPSSLLQERFDRLATSAGVACELFVSRIAQVPTVLGHMRPVILLPVSAITGLSPAQVEALLLHELAHVRRHDYLINLTQTAIETTLFFHPAVWWISHRIRIEREFCCDDSAVAALDDPKTYAKALAAMEETRHTGLALAANGGVLLPRIQRVLGILPPRAHEPRAVALGSLGSAALLATVLSCAAWQDKDAPRPDRAKFAAKIATVRIGMTKAEVLDILGRPDDIVTAKDKILPANQTNEILGYGNGKNRKQYVVGGKVEFRVTDGTHLSFPTLGCVHIDSNGKVRSVYGGKPYKPIGLTERRLRELLEILDEAPSYNSGQYTPCAVIDVVNALHPLGKDRALAVIDEYLRVASRERLPARQGLFLVLRVLFDVPATGFHRTMNVGAPVPAAPQRPKVFPRFPIALVDDIPYLLVQGYRVAGRPERVERHVVHFRKNGVLRQAPLRPFAGHEQSFQALRIKVKGALEPSDVVLASLAQQWTSVSGEPVSTNIGGRVVPTPKKITRVILPDHPTAAMTKMIADLKRPTRLYLSFSKAPMDGVATALARISSFPIAVSPKAQKKLVSIKIQRTSMLDTLIDLAEQSGNFILVANGVVQVISEAEAGLHANARGETQPTGDGQGKSYTPVLEMRMVAKRRTGFDVDLAEEKRRLAAWLANAKNREEILANPLRIASFHGLAANRNGPLSKQIRWVPHRILARTRDQFGYFFSRDKHLGHAVCATFSMQRLATGPTGMEDTLLEFLAIDLQETGFTMPAFDTSKFRRTRISDRMALCYELRPDRADDYAKLTDRRTRDSIAIVLDGYLVSAPRIMARIPGRGQIVGLSDATLTRFMRAIGRKR